MARLLSHRLSWVVVALIVVGFAVSPAARAARVTARPTIASLTSLAWTDPAGVVQARLRAVNRRSVATPATTVRLYLSKDKRLDAKDDALRGTISVPRLRPGRSMTRQTDLALPADVRLGRRWLLACISGHCTASAHRLQVTASPRTSGDLIDAARAAHRISAGSAVVYKVFAAIGDPRLPAQYRGDDHPLVGDSATRDAAAAWGTLTVKQRGVIAPYFQAPTSTRGWTPAVRPRSAAAVATDCQHLGPEGDGFAHVDSPGGHVRIWFPRTGLPKVAAAAPGLARAADHIWDRLTALMGRQPLSDKNYCGRNGGDGRYDIFLMNGSNGEIPGRGITGPYRGYSLTGAAPAVTEFNCGTDDPPSPWELAHEIFHAFQFSYRHAVSITKYDGFDEGSADWAANYVYPADDTEHVYRDMLQFPEYTTLPDNAYGYDLWVFDYYLTQTSGNDLIPQIYDQFQHENELTAVNSVIPGGFAKSMLGFTRYGWNQTPVKDGFRAWDRLSYVPLTGNQPVTAMNLKIGGLTQRTLNLPDSLRPLARAYNAVHIADSNIHDIRFNNTVHGIQGAGVQAFVKLADGTWHTQDWSNRSTVEFCRDAGPEQDVTDLVIMYSNARYGDSRPLHPSKQPTLDIRNNCNHYYIVKSVTATYGEDFSYIDSTHGYSCTDSGTQQYTGSYDPARPDATGPTDGFWAPGKFGGIDVPIVYSGSEQYQQGNCQGGAPFLPACSATISEHGTPTTYLGDMSDPPNRVTVQLPVLDHMADWSTDNACDSEFGYGNADTTVHYIDGGNVSVATLEGTQAFTLHGTNTFDDGYGHHFTRSVSVTLLPTDENGIPLAA